MTRHLEVLHQQWHGCKKCSVCEMRGSDDIFFGYGPDSPRYLVVGGTPTSVDEEFSSLFAGEPGNLIFTMLDKAEISVDDCYFTYALSCRPKVIIPATELEAERIETREPSKEEYAACRPRLYEILYRTDPRCVIAFGEVAARALLRARWKYADIVGKQFKMTMPAASREDHITKKTQGKSRWMDIGYQVFLSWDPQTILNNPSQADHGPLQLSLRTLKRANDYTSFVLRAEADTIAKEA